jgi:FkbM family methyltransferase
MLKGLMRSIGLAGKYETLSHRGRKVRVRSGESVDREVFEYVFEKGYHRPHRKLRDDAVILDLGCNIGFSVVDLKMEYPAAKVFAVEMDADNFKLAQENVSGLADVVVYNYAIWESDGVVRYLDSDNVDAYHVEADTTGSSKGKFVEVNGISLNTLLAKIGQPAIDYVKMDIEGAERNVFNADLSWLDLVKEIKIEIHKAEDFEPIESILKQRGFTTLKDTNHWSTIIAFLK